MRRTSGIEYERFFRRKGNQRSMSFPTREDLNDRYRRDPAFDEKIELTLASVRKLQAEGWTHHDHWPRRAPKLPGYIADHIYRLKRGKEVVCVCEPYADDTLEICLRSLDEQGYYYRVREDVGIHFPPNCTPVWISRDVASLELSSEKMTATLQQ